MHSGMRQGVSVLWMAVLLAGSFMTLSSKASGVSNYLPLNQSVRAEAEIDRVIALTNGNALIKPYKVADIQARVAQIKTTYPTLYKRVTSYLKRYQTPLGITHAGAEVAATSDAKGNLPNAHGKSMDTNYEVALAGYYQPSDYLLFSAGGVYNDTDKWRHTGSFVGMGFEYAQLDIGYREHWYSPFKHAAMLMSTHAEAAPSVTLSNVQPITGWDIRYELFYSELAEVDEIRLGDEVYPGRPRHAGLHLSFSPLENWTFGVNRTLQFGGGARDAGFSDFFEALFNPAGKDNIEDRSGDPNYEFGNQQASVTARYHANWGMPLEFYGEYGGEDTEGEKNYKLGNITAGLGVFAPYVTDNLALRFEYNHWSHLWYVHHIYRDGYVNDGVIMGHWAAELRGDERRAPGGAVHTLSAHWEISSSRFVDTRVSVIRNDENTQRDYETGYQLKTTYSEVIGDGILGVTLFLQRDTFGDSQSRLALSYQW
ncbi:capsule assembly Wzi family protein [Alteromonas halophila]|uniref:Membrane protein n=1 Tax=Alteromonas halophila TaxID=516698 RepID=A0A918MWQ3_9ALTE|nr:capsule assembly Wzi family protein [Alteromonas halophila]GGW78439.1 membrane protein [Alteromonas halophila]